MIRQYFRPVPKNVVEDAQLSDEEDIPLEPAQQPSQEPAQQQAKPQLTFESCSTIGKFLNGKNYDWLNYGAKVFGKYPTVCSICYGKEGKCKKSSYSYVALRQVTSRELNKHEVSDEHEKNKAALSTGTVLTCM